MTSRWIAARVIREIVRDRRTVAFFVLIPVVVMTLIYYAVVEDEIARVGVLTRGVARLFEGDLINALDAEDDIIIVDLDIDDEETDPDVLAAAIETHLRDGRADGILYMEEQLLIERFAGERGTLHVWVEGSRPTITGAVFSGIAGAMDDLAAALPVVIDSSCSTKCGESVNVQPMELEKNFLHGSDDYRTIDFFLPVLPPFFVFFFTFIISTITFQRERVRGTLERLLIAPVAFHEVVLGYVGGFFIFACVQATIIIAYFVVLISFPLSVAQLFALGVVILFMLLTALMLGLLVSFLANNEFQAVQFVPLVILPQLFLSDIIWSVESFPLFFQVISYALPLTHANIAVRAVLLRGESLWSTWPSLAVLVAFFAAILALLLLVGRSPKRAV